MSFMLLLYIKLSETPPASRLTAGEYMHFAYVSGAKLRQLKLALT